MFRPFNEDESQETTKTYLQVYFGYKVAYRRSKTGFNQPGYTEKVEIKMRGVDGKISTTLICGQYSSKEWRRGDLCDPRRECIVSRVISEIVSYF